MSCVGSPLVKNSRFVLIPVYGAKTPFGSRTIVCRLHSVSSFSSKSQISLPLLELLWQEFQKQVSSDFVEVVEVVCQFELLQHIDESPPRSWLVF